MPPKKSKKADAFELSDDRFKELIEDIKSGKACARKVTKSRVAKHRMTEPEMKSFDSIVKKDKSISWKALMEKFSTTTVGSLRSYAKLSHEAGHLKTPPPLTAAQKAAKEKKLAAAKAKAPAKKASPVKKSPAKKKAAKKKSPAKKKAAKKK